MTLQNLWKKLRKYNRKDYRQFQFVILFAEMLISSYLMMLFSPLVQKALPDGGDTIKIATLVFGIAVVGCFVFVWYAARLFLRYKSREIGIFLALGAEKREFVRRLICGAGENDVCLHCGGNRSGSSIVRSGRKNNGEDHRDGQ